MNEELIKFINICLIDGVVTDKEREVIFRKSKELGVPEDECEIILEGMIHQSSSKQEQKVTPKTISPKPKNNVVKTVQNKKKPIIKKDSFFSKEIDSLENSIKQLEKKEKLTREKIHESTLKINSLKEKFISKINSTKLQIGDEIHIGEDVFQINEIIKRNELEKYLKKSGDFIFTTSFEVTNNNRGIFELPKLKSSSDLPGIKLNDIELPHQLFLFFKKPIIKKISLVNRLVTINKKSYSWYKKIHSLKGLKFSYDLFNEYKDFDECYISSIRFIDEFHFDFLLVFGYEKHNILCKVTSLFDTERCEIDIRKNEKEWNLIDIDINGRGVEIQYSRYSEGYDFDLHYSTIKSEFHFINDEFKVQG